VAIFASRRGLESPASKSPVMCIARVRAVQAGCRWQPGGRAKPRPAPSGLSEGFRAEARDRRGETIRFGRRSWSHVLGCERNRKRGKPAEHRIPAVPVFTGQGPEAVTAKRFGREPAPCVGPINRHLSVVQ
jgi:hypothetical protein